MNIKFKDVKRWKRCKRCPEE